MRLLYFIVGSSVLIGLVLLVRKVFRRQIAPGMLYALWLIPLIRLLIPFGFFETPVFGTAAEVFRSPYVVLSGAGDLLERMTDGGLRESYADGRIQKESEEAAKADQEGTAADQGQVISAVNESAQTAQHADSEAIPAMRQEKTDSKAVLVAAVIWLCVSVLLGSYAWMSNRRLRRSIRHMKETDAVCLLPVYVSDAVVSPCLFGLFRPRILVNRSVAEDPVLYHYVLEHELTHYRQKDHIWTFLRILLCVVYWWNPLVWIGASCAGEDAELSCDAKVVRGLSAAGRKAYGYSLLQLLENAQRGGGGMCVATSVSGGKASLKRRLEGIAGGTKTKKKVLLPICILLAAALLYGCSVPSGKSWMKAVPEDPALLETDVDYEMSLQDEVQSRLFYYEIYQYGELTERRVMACGKLEGEGRRGFRAGLTLAPAESEEAERLVFRLEDEAVIDIPIAAADMGENSAESYESMLRGRSLLWDNGEKQEIKSGDDLILMADYYQVSERDSLLYVSCEELMEETGLHKELSDAYAYMTVLIHMVLSDQPEEQLWEQYSRTEYPQKEEISDADGEQEFLKSWADAFVNRDGNELLGMMSEEVMRQMLEDGWLLTEEDDDFVYFGWSSPWPMFGEGELYRILKNDGQKAEILYYAGDSEPHLYVWRETLEYEQRDDSRQVISESVEELYGISSAEEFYRAYPDGEITGTMMDYQANGLGQFLNDHALEGSNDKIYSRLLDVRQAALDLLNISYMKNGEWQDISDKVEVISGESGDKTIVRITFLQDGSTVEVSMIQPYGEDGIWIPQTAESLGNQL